ncbi:GbsR/MarR family transcriptional regulator [Alicyclobacillus mengziensis]|uniref:HTH-type transcriptional regulator n=1 Tax=Alicyclobacillus mengziensis TaxID=2931921 RepID=A0A9X7Z6Q6_9BACL|nr:transcriptional regulator [Alicyclobacillus mengziensis]QSO46505.1 transcriptional regulator [Alicyclobacillus mengziensis]
MITTTGEVQDLRQQMVHAIASVMGWYDLTHSASELYAYMFFEDRPMTLEEMKDVMGMSKSSMSYAVRSLIEAKMINKLDYKLDRKELFRADPDFLSSFQQFLTSKLEHEIEVVTGVIDEVIPRLKQILDNRNTDEVTRQDANHDLGKVVHAKNYYVWLHQFVERLKSETL